MPPPPPHLILPCYNTVAFTWSVLHAETGTNKTPFPLATLPAVGDPPICSCPNVSGWRALPQSLLELLCGCTLTILFCTGFPVALSTLLSLMYAKDLELTNCILLTNTSSDNLSITKHSSIHLVAYNRNKEETSTYQLLFPTLPLTSSFPTLRSLQKEVQINPDVSIVANTTDTDDALDQCCPIRGPRYAARIMRPADWFQEACPSSPNFLVS